MVVIPKLGMPAVAAFSYLIRYNIYTLVFAVWLLPGHWFLYQKAINNNKALYAK